MEEEVREKKKVLKQLGYKLTQEEVAALEHCASDLQLDQVARRILKSR